jgi:hypothetical protein
MNPTHRRTTEIPGPHRLQERAPRPEDLEYQDKLEFQKEQEEDDQQHKPPNQTNLVLDIVQQLAKAMRDNTTTDISDPSKFSGEDHHWDEWHYQLRSYLSAKGWLHIYDHTTGPGTLGFDV